MLIFAQSIKICETHEKSMRADISALNVNHTGSVMVHLFFLVFQNDKSIIFEEKYVRLNCNSSITLLGSIATVLKNASSRAARDHCIAAIPPDKD